MKVIYPKGEKLALDLSRILSTDNEIIVKSDQNPVFFEYEGQGYYVYLKCVSWGGNPYPQNTTRAQLPKRPIFSQIKDSDNIFMFWGYDIDNQVYVCWDPNIAKSRLNHKSYVSFFSRKNEQEKATEGHPNQASLSNGLKYVCFKTVDSIHIIKNLSDYFPIHIHKSISVGEPSPKEDDNTEKVHSGILNNVNDDLSVKLLIDSLRNNDDSSTLEIISKTMNTFSSDYPLMTLKNWYHIIEKYKKENPVEEEVNMDDI